MDEAGVNLVKVFSATKARNREGLGEQVTAWMRSHPAVAIRSAVVRLSSDSEFHCLTIVLFGREEEGAQP